MKEEILENRPEPMTVKQVAKKRWIGCRDKCECKAMLSEWGSLHFFHYLDGDGVCGEKESRSALINIAASVGEIHVFDTKNDLLEWLKD